VPPDAAEASRVTAVRDPVRGALLAEVPDMAAEEVRAPIAY
jgi:hypothetical protein